MPAHTDLLDQARPFCDPANGEVVQRLPDELMRQLRAAKLARGISGCRSHHTQTRATWYVFLTDQIRDRVLLDSQEAKQKAKRERKAVSVPVDHTVEPTAGWRRSIRLAAAGTARTGAVSTGETAGCPF